MHKKPIFTVGHSTHSTSEFFKILETYDIQVLVDVRRFPGQKLILNSAKLV